MATPIPQNLAPFSGAEILAATGGRPMHWPASGLVVSGVATDTRQELQGKLFIALDGARFDAHSFLAQAAAAGAVAAVVSAAERSPAGLPQCVVPDTTRALGDLARLHRRRWRGRLVAIGGSAGKTTTRATCQALLDRLASRASHCTAGNLNNRIGVPMTLLGLQESHSLAAVEVGTNLRFEVAELARICQPDVGVLTLVDWEHSEGIGDLDAIEAEEGDLLAALPAHGVGVVNGDDPRCVRQLERVPSGRGIRYGFTAGVDYRIEQRSPGLPASTLVVSRPRGGALELCTELVGPAGALAVVASLAVAEQLHGRPLDRELVQEALDTVGQGIAGRLNLVGLPQGTWLIDDSYNANPASVRSSIRAAREIAEARSARLVVVLGEMRELGSVAEQEHRALGDALLPGDWLLAVAGDAELTAGVARSRGVDSEFVEDAAMASRRALEGIQRGDVVLVKGSRGVRLDRVVQALVEAGGEAA